MDELPLNSMDLISALDEIFKEEESSELLRKSKDGTLHEYLGQRSVVEFLLKLKQRELEEVH